jgi:hypothetical protein
MMTLAIFSSQYFVAQMGTPDFESLSFCPDFAWAGTKFLLALVLFI